MAKSKLQLEVHTHHIVRGPFAHGGLYDRNGQWDTGVVVHSHPGGGIPHTHVAMGPAGYTIDKDAWLKATGLRGGGRKKFTSNSSGPQMPFVALTEEQSTFLVIMCPSGRDLALTQNVTGGGEATAHRIQQTFRLKRRN